MYILNAPLLLVIEVTGKCNLKCKYCYNKLGRTNPIDIDKDSLLTILNEARKIGVFDINFCGGEPFVNDSFIEYLEASKSLGFDITINSNGTLINDNIAKRLKSLDVIQHTQISLDGHNSNLNDYTRGNFNQAYSGFLLLCKYATDKSMAPSIGVVITNNNFMHLEEIIRHFSQYTDRIHLMNVMGHPKLQLSEKDRNHFQSTILPKITQYAVSNRIQITRLNKLNICDEFLYKGIHVDCLAGHTFLAITPGLDVLACDICREPIGKWMKSGDISLLHKKSRDIWSSLQKPWCMS